MTDCNLLNCSFADLANAVVNGNDAFADFVFHGLNGFNKANQNDIYFCVTPLNCWGNFNDCDFVSFWVDPSDNLHCGNFGTSNTLNDVVGLCVNYTCNYDTDDTCLVLTGYLLAADLDNNKVLFLTDGYNPVWTDPSNCTVNTPNGVFNLTYFVH